MGNDMDIDGVLGPVCCDAPGASDHGIGDDARYEGVPGWP
jgi:hypothetical protein